MTTTTGAGDWTEPGVYPVAPGVHRIPLPLPTDGLRAVNIYAIDDGNGLVFVDSGWAVPVARELLGAALRTLDCSLSDIHRFLITHMHRDHYTQAIEIRREAGNRVSLGAGERPGMETARSADRTPMEPQLRQLRRCGAGELADAMAAWLAEQRFDGDRSDWEDPDDWIEPGRLTLDGGRDLTVVETPGHTQGHVVFHDSAGELLFAGDHVLPTITPSIGFEPILAANPLGDFLASLAKVRALPDAMLLPAHGAVTASVHARVDELVDHHGRRLDGTAAAVDKGLTDAFEAAHQLRWTRRERKLTELDAYNQMLAICETAAHLELLVAQDRLSRQIDDSGVWRYLPQT
ncbi:MAG: MBL fold metallo-hydrolase [Actinomycetota bacterium]|nr:MBL fold metallo-hydrolase [Actinomycetota bacterium]